MMRNARQNVGQQYTMNSPSGPVSNIAENLKLLANPQTRNPYLKALSGTREGRPVSDLFDFTDFITQLGGKVPRKVKAQRQGELKELRRAYDISMRASRRDNMPGFTAYLEKDKQKALKYVQQQHREETEQVNLVKRVGQVGEKALGKATEFGKKWAYDPQTRRPLPQSPLYPGNPPHPMMAGLKRYLTTGDKTMTNEELMRMLPMVALTTAPVAVKGGLVGNQLLQQLRQQGYPNQNIVYRAVDSGGRGSTLGKGKYFNFNKNEAMRWGSDVRAFRLDPKAKMLDLTEPIRLQNATEEAIKANRGQYLYILKHKGATEALGEILADWAKKLGYDGIKSVDSVFGSVVFKSEFLKPLSKFLKPL